MSSIRRALRRQREVFTYLDRTGTKPPRWAMPCGRTKDNAFHRRNEAVRMAQRHWRKVRLADYLRRRL